MPIVEHDPWRVQYFESVACPDEVHIPTDDGDAYRLYPLYRWVYNKLAVAESQGFETGLHGVDPPAYPVFSKPVYNMRGMGTESRVLRSEKEYLRYLKPGHFWLPLLEGDHISSDVAVVDGDPRWWRHVTGRALDQGTFDYWTIHAEARPAVEDYCGDWLRKNLKGYTGMVNFETIGARIIEVHLRFADQWPDLYGAGWLDAVVRLYAEGRWEFGDADRRTGYSVVLFGAHGVQYHHPEPSLVAELRADAAISSIQITFHEDRPPWAHAMPPGGFRLAIVNCWNLEAGMAARQQLALAYWSTQELLRRGRRKRADSVKDAEHAGR